jgi:hypothetical protein
VSVCSSAAALITLEARLLVKVAGMRPDLPEQGAERSFDALPADPIRVHLRRTIQHVERRLQRRVLHAVVATPTG